MANTRADHPIASDDARKLPAVPPTPLPPIVPTVDDFAQAMRVALIDLGQPIDTRRAVVTGAELEALAIAVERLATERRRAVEAQRRRRVRGRARERGQRAA